MLKKWFSKTQKQTHKDRSPLQEVSDNFYHGKYRACIEGARLLFDHPDVGLKWDAKRFSGLANYRLKRFAEASKIFEEIANYSNTTDDWFNLMTASVRNKQIDLGEYAFQRFSDESSIKGSNQMLTYSNVLYQMMIAYQDIGEYKKSLEKLIVLKRYITQVKEHNSDYLGKHGVPFIFQTLISARATLENQYSKEQIEAFLQDFEKQLDSDGKESIEEFRMALTK